MGTTKMEFPCGFKLETDIKYLKGIKPGDMQCPMHGRRCIRKKQNITKMLELQNNRAYISGINN